MVRGSCPKFGSEARAFIGRELIGVKAQSESQLRSGAKHDARFLRGKNERFDENIAIARQIFGSHAREHFVDYDCDVIVDPAAELIGDFVRAKKCGDATKRPPLIHLTDDA